MDRRVFSKRFVSILLPAVLAPAAAHAEAGREMGRDFADLSLEELANIQVTSVSKRAESLSEASASIFVITGDDIRRAGAPTLPEALRLAPNLQVARVDARNYAITARGFNNPLENKLLVLIDGRIVYSPLFSGVYWDVQNLVMEDIDRIEVISGPGSTLWGANAVNGVINVITRSAEQTQGTYAKGIAGNESKSGSLQHGGVMSNGGYYRVYGKHEEDDNQQRANGANAVDGMRHDAAGFRMDWNNGAATYAVSGDTYTGRLHQLGTDDIRVAGGNVTGHVTRRLSPDSELSALAYIDYTERNQPGAFIEHLTTLDLEAQQDVQLSGHHVIWGGSYRAGLDHVQVNGNGFAFLPGTLNMVWGSLFAQDEIALRDNLKLTAGLKLESNNYTGIEYLPNLRLAWRPRPDRMAWASLSRSVRAPSRIDRDFFAPANPPMQGGVPQYFVSGGPGFRSEVANVAELGYRAQPRANLSYSITAFASRYDNLRTLEPNRAGPGMVFSNMAEGSTRGVEAWGSWQAAPSWRLSSGATVQRVNVRPKPGSADSIGSSSLAINDPSSWWMLRSSHDLSSNTELDLMLRHVNALPHPSLPGYTAVDMNIGWKVRPGIELSLSGRNLGGGHVEFGSPATGVDFGRALFLKLVLKM
jgi:iron complex outermembrane receptor protein